MKKILALLLALVMLVQYVPVTARAAGDVASVTKGGTTTNYTSLSSAFSAVKSATEADNAVVTLLTDITLSYDTSVSGGVLTLDLNGHTITCQGTEAAIWLYNSAKLTIVDSGEDGGFNVVYGIEDSAVVLYGNSVLTITGGKFNKVAALFRSSDAQVNITGGTFDYNGQVIKYGPTSVAKITGGTFAVEPDAYLVSEGYAAKQDASGKWVVAEGSGGSVDTVVAITDIIYSDYNGNGAVAVDEANKTYTVTIPEGSESVTVTVTVKGRNLGLIPEGNNKYGIGISKVAYLSPEMYDADTGTMTLTIEVDDEFVERYANGGPVYYTLTSGGTYQQTEWRLKVVKVEPATYTVNVAETTGGTVTADKATAAEDETVTLTVTPDEGYDLRTLIVTNLVDTDENIVPTLGKDGKYTFLMLGADVEVHAAFAPHTHTPEADDGNCLTEQKCTVCGETAVEAKESHAYGDDHFCDACGTDGHISIYYHSLTLKDFIGVNFYVSLCDEIVANPAYMVFTYEDGTEETVELTHDRASEPFADGRTFYKFSAKVAAKEMNDVIKADFHYTLNGENLVFHDSYSVKQYADLIIADQDQPEDMVALAKTMLHYGAYAQLEFEYKTNDLANKDLAPLDMSGVTVDAPTFANGEISGVSFGGASLLLRSETILRLFFEVEDPENFSVTYGEQALEVKTRSGLYYVDITGISAKDLENDVMVNVNGTPFTYSVMAYCYNVLNTEEGTQDEALVNVVKALVLYNRAADGHFAAQNAKN